jgi:hypothetical protein
MYQYFGEILYDGEIPTYPGLISVPNIVATGTFTDPVEAGFEQNGLVSSSNKFPGRAVCLPTGSTPVVYPGKLGKSRNFILPGLFNVDQAVQTLYQLHEITHPKKAAELNKSRKRKRKFNGVQK